MNMYFLIFFCLFLFLFYTVLENPNKYLLTRDWLINSFQIQVNSHNFNQVPGQKQTRIWEYMVPPLNHLNSYRLFLTPQTCQFRVGESLSKEVGFLFCESRGDFQFRFCFLFCFIVGVKKKKQPINQAWRCMPLTPALWDAETGSRVWG